MLLFEIQVADAVVFVEPQLREWSALANGGGVLVVEGVAESGALHTV